MVAIHVQRSSALAASAAEVWAVVSTMDGVNDELRPYVRMTFPSSIRSLDPASIVPGEVLFRSWLLAGRIIPFDRHSLALLSIEDGAGFVEESTSWMQRTWQHERTVTAVGTGCVVTDRLVIVPRVALMRPVVAMVVGRLFSHRHQRLIRRFGRSDLSMT